MERGNSLRLRAASRISSRAFAIESVTSLSPGRMRPLAKRRVFQSYRVTDVECHDVLGYCYKLGAFSIALIHLQRFQYRWSYWERTRGSDASSCGWKCGV